jgi:hypothetical protein
MREVYPVGRAEVESPSLECGELDAAFFLYTGCEPLLAIVRRKRGSSAKKESGVETAALQRALTSS